MAFLSFLSVEVRSVHSWLILLSNNIACYYAVMVVLVGCQVARARLILLFLPLTVPHTVTEAGYTPHTP